MSLNHCKYLMSHISHVLFCAGRADRAEDMDISELKQIHLSTPCMTFAALPQTRTDMKVTWEITLFIVTLHQHVLCTDPLRNRRSPACKCSSLLSPVCQSKHRSFIVLHCKAALNDSLVQINPSDNWPVGSPFARLTDVSDRPTPRSHRQPSVCFQTTAHLATCISGHFVVQSVHSEALYPSPEAVIRFGVYHLSSRASI